MIDPHGRVLVSLALGDEGAFDLNGEGLLLRGTHRHEEHAGLGAAMPNALQRRDMEAMKELGDLLDIRGYASTDATFSRAPGRPADLVIDLPGGDQIIIVNTLDDGVADDARSDQGSLRSVSSTIWPGKICETYLETTARNAGQNKSRIKL